MIPGVGSRMTSATPLLALGAAILILVSSCSSQSEEDVVPTGSGSNQSAPPWVECGSRPSSCGYPDESSTGVPPDTTLVDVPAQATSGPGWEVDPRGWISVSEDGAIIDGIRTNLSIDVSADDVVLRNSEIVVGGDTWAIVTRMTNNVTIANNTISAPSSDGPNRLLVGIKDIEGGSSGLRIIGNDISHTATGIQIDSGLIQDNYIHDLGFNSGDHVNGTTSNAGTSLLVIQHNTVFNQRSQTDAISLFQDFGPQSNRTIIDNLVAGGSYTIYAGANEGKEATATNIRVLNNRVSTRYFPRGGDFGPANAYAPSAGNEWAGNTWDHDGSIIPPP